ncbi:hypothetical protein FS749_009099, partial [Ceratobasidium sp. UAMH 11750]
QNRNKNISVPEPVPPASLPESDQQDIELPAWDPNPGALPDSPILPEHASSNERPDLAWFKKQNYNQIVEPDGIRYVHSTHGRPLGKSTTAWEDLLKEREKQHPNAPFFPFPNLAQWKLAHWLATCKASQAKIDEFLAMDGILAETPCFRTAAELFNMIEHNIVGFGGPEWFEQDITLPEAPNEPLTLFLRDLEDCADYLANRPDLAGEIEFQPQVVFEPDDTTQVFGEMFTAHNWHALLELANLHPDAALGGILFGSDVTHLTQYSGDVKVHALYMTLANIHKDTRNATSRRAWMLIAYIPISKWETTLASMEFRCKTHQKSLPGIFNRRVFHLSMRTICQPLFEPEVHEIVDPEGIVRLIIYFLIAYLADLEEQYKIAALDKSNCIHCTSIVTEFGSNEKHEPRTSESILKAISNVQAKRGPNADPYEFSLGADKYQLGDVEYPFWESLPFMDICKVLSVDLLHGFHKFFFDHPFDWNVHSLGEEEIDARMKSQIPLVGGRVFPRGVTHISQMSGKEHRALETVHLAVVANSSIAYGHQLTNATRSLLDFIYLAQLPTHTDKTLAMFDEAYNNFHEQKNVWIKNGGRQGEKGNLIEHFNIPKLHHAGHLSEQVRAKGTADNYSTETIEHLHIDTLKEPYKATNRKQWKKQTTRYLTRHDKLMDFSLFLDWAMKRQQAHGELESENAVNTSTTALVGAGAPMSAPGRCCPHICTQVLVASQPAKNWMKQDDILVQPIPPHSTSHSLVPHVMPQPGIQSKKKRKRVSDEEREERTSKRILASQQLYGLSAHQDVSLRPIERMTVLELQASYQLPNFLLEYQASTHQSMYPMDINSVVETWQSMRLIERPHRFCPKPKWRRAQAIPPTNTEVAVSDPVLYTKELVGDGESGPVKLGDCHVAQIRLIFWVTSADKRNEATHSSPIFVYASAFLAVPRTPEISTGMFVINKPARGRMVLLEGKRIVRICPLSPRFSGPARRDVTPATAIESYSTFYINKYNSLSDFVYTNNL